MSVETGPIAGDNIAVVIDSGLALVDFLNYRLTAKKDLSDLLQSNGIEQEHELPGLVIKVYLLLTQKMNVDVFDPLTKKRSSSENDVTVVVENPSQLWGHRILLYLSKENLWFLWKAGQEEARNTATPIQSDNVETIQVIDVSEESDEIPKKKRAKLSAGQIHQSFSKQQASTVKSKKVNKVSESNVVPQIEQPISGESPNVSCFPCIVCKAKFDSTTMRNYHESVDHKGNGQQIRMHFRV